MANPLTSRVSDSSKDQAKRVGALNHLNRICTTIAALSLVFVASPALANPAYDKFAKASDEYVAALDDTTTRYAELQKEWDKIKRRGEMAVKRRQVVAIEREQQALGATLAAAKQKYDTALAAWKETTKDYTDIEKQARAAWNTLRTTTEGTPVKRQRAMKAIELDLPKLIPGAYVDQSEVEQVSKMVQDGLRAGRPIIELQNQVNKRLDGNPTTQHMFKEAFGALENSVNDLPRMERVKRFTKIVSTLSNISKAVGVGGAANSSDPLRNSQISSLTGTVDLISDIVPSSPLRWQLQLQKSLLDQVQSNMARLQKVKIQGNLTQLLNQALGPFAVEYGDRNWGLQDNLLFGIPGPNPKITPEKTTFRVGEPIKGKWFGSLRYDEGAWLGIVPKSTAHGKETVGDDADLDYFHLEEDDKGTFEFSTSLTPGDYDLRMYDDDDGGKEVYSVSIKVQSDLSGVWQLEGTDGTSRIFQNDNSFRMRTINPGTFNPSFETGSIGIRGSVDGSNVSGSMALRLSDSQQFRRCPRSYWVRFSGTVSSNGQEFSGMFSGINIDTSTCQSRPAGLRPFKFVRIGD